MYSFFRINLFATLLTMLTFNSQEQCHKDNLVFALNVNICINVVRVNKVGKKRETTPTAS